ncbi:MAG: patatin-like phospholipase family protein [Candidatus Marinimicrobia bacterium]|nr:patatin-like phospholipase family protein [bacterium]MCG2716493.1 patatin-like phospholipase family protein [Candidatus Neomarinimicrobiota bacterium]
MKNQIGNKKVGLVLGSGSAKGLSHIGVLKYLEEAEIKIDFIAGSSIGAMIGGAYAAGISINEIEDIALKTDLASSVKYFLPTISKSGLISGTKVKEFLRDIVGDIEIENLKIPFTATATDIFTGQEINFNKGNLVEAIRASISVPVIFQPVIHGDQILVDGGLSNPLPINVVCKMGADFIIAVNVMPALNKTKPVKKKENENLRASALTAEMKSAMRKKLEALNIDDRWIKVLLTKKKKYNVPGLISVMVQSVYITQRKLARLSIQLYKPDILIEPDIPFAGFFDFYKAREIIDIGYKAAQDAFYDNNL